jgi:hypothetical protein
MRQFCHFLADLWTVGLTAVRRKSGGKGREKLSFTALVGIISYPAVPTQRGPGRFAYLACVEECLQALHCAPVRVSPYACNNGKKKQKEVGREMREI